MTVVELWRYPVKSMGGERVERARVDPAIEGDRAWGVFDAATGKLLSAKSVGALLAARARWVDGEAVIELPGGDRVVAGTPAAERAIGALVERAVVLRRAGGDAVAMIDMEVDDGAGSGPNRVTTFGTSPGMLFDSKSTLHLVGAATLAGLDRELAPGAGDVRRFRPNLVIDGIDALAEDDWVGDHVRVGGVVAHVRKRTERCVIVSRAQPGLDRDRGLLRHLATRRDMRFGVYLDPRAPGDIAVGDRIERVTV